MTPTWGTATSGACGNCHDTNLSDTTAGTTKSTGSHTTHLNSAAGRGPDALACSNCHTAETTTSHVNGFVNFTGTTTLATTTACDTCHSPLGDYDGVDNAVTGAKANWAAGVYDTSNPPVLTSGKEKWCVGCHDNSAPTISGVTAPNVAGNAATTPGWMAGSGSSGYGFFFTGHGRPGVASYLSTIGKSCTDCHKPNMDHIDGNARTYSAASSNYTTGYRLKKNMTVPRLTSWGYNVDVYAKTPAQIAAIEYEFELCLSCHTDNPADTETTYSHDQFFEKSSTAQTNFRNSSGTFVQNKHHLHLSLSARDRWDSDWSTGTNYDSKISCTTCHNVHGSTRQAMMHDGVLNGGYNIDFSYTPSITTLLGASTGGTFSSTNMCEDCHGGCFGGICGEIGGGPPPAKTYTRTVVPTAPP